MTQTTARDRRKFRREFHRKGYWAVYQQVSGYPRGKRELAHEWLRERERASGTRARWIFTAGVAILVAAAAVVGYLAVDHLNWF
jgi:uncharacterized membrane protein YkvA (DUF1232 family)